MNAAPGQIIYPTCETTATISGMKQLSCGSSAGRGATGVALVDGGQPVRLDRVEEPARGTARHQAVAATQAGGVQAHQTTGL